MFYLNQIIISYPHSFRAYFLYLFLINVLTFILMGIDKYRSRKNQWRIKEITLIILGIMGGGTGIILAMLVFHHKINRRKFYLGMPLLYIANKITSAVLYHYLIKKHFFHIY